MLRTRNVQPSLWESVLPEVCLRLPAELARVDEWLDDERFFAPFREYFDPRLGRPSLPMETYLRLMFLKHRYRPGYETLCTEVADSISWRRFCRIDIDGRVPHPTTLMKITTRCGSEAVAALNEVLLAKAVEAKLVKTGKVRADTTVVSANVEYPTDAGLLAKAVARIGRVVSRVKAAGGAVRTIFVDRRRAAARRMRELTSKLHLRTAVNREQTRTAIVRISGQLKDLAQRAISQAHTVLHAAKRAVNKTAGQVGGRLRRADGELAVLIERAGRIVAQTHRRFAGDMPASATRLVSLHDPDARPTPPSWPRRSPGSSIGQAKHLVQWPLTAATAKRAWKTNCANSGGKPLPYRVKAPPGRPGASMNVDKRSANWSNGVPEPRDVSAT